MILVIFDLNFRLWPKLYKLNKEILLDRRKQLCNFKREQHCCYDGLPLPKKRFSYEKCFVLPVVDLKLHSSFEVLIMFSGLNAIWNRIHLKLLCKLHFLLGSLTYLHLNRYIYNTLNSGKKCHLLSATQIFES